MSVFSWSWTSPPLRLDKALKLVYPFLSQKIIQMWLNNTGVLVNQQSVPSHTLLCPKDQISIQDATPLVSMYPQPNPSLPFQVCFENDDILVINKPAGLPSHPLTPWDTESAVQSVLAHRPMLQGVGETRAPGLLHRLDNETSGLLVFAKTASAHERYANDLHQGLWKKEYLCWVYGTLHAAQTVDAAICHHTSNARMVLADLARYGRGNPQPAVTHLRPIQVQDISWLDPTARPSSPPCPITAVWVHIETGVRHQIRVHLASLGHPIVGDPLYQLLPPHADPTAASLPMVLHAWRLTLPSMGHSLEIVCPPPFPFPAPSAHISLISPS